MATLTEKKKEPSPLLPTTSRFSNSTAHTTEIPAQHAPSPTAAHPPAHLVAPFSCNFNDPRIAPQRKAFLKAMIFGGIFLTIVIFAVFSIYWGALYLVPCGKLKGWVVDLDGGRIGNSTLAALQEANANPAGTVDWQIQPASRFVGGAAEIADRIVNQNAWVAIVINEGASDRLSNAVANVDASYNSTDAITVFVNEARQENAFRSLIRPYLWKVLPTLAERFSEELSSELATQNPGSVVNILRNAPQIITLPVGYTIDNLRPFDYPVATAVTFVGLIYLLVLSFVIVQICAGARFISGLETKLSTVSLIKTRIVTSFIIYFFISIFYSSLTAAFQVKFGRKYDSAGFVIFWMLHFLAMSALGLALESMITLLTPRFIPFFVILWLLSNVSVAFMPIDVLPSFYHYGYAFPFWHVSSAIRSILFRTKNTLGLNFGVLIAWVCVSLISLPLFQWFMRRRMITKIAAQKAREANEAPPVAAPPVPVPQAASLPPQPESEKAGRWRQVGKMVGRVPVKGKGKTPETINEKDTPVTEETGNERGDVGEDRRL
ncbi:hypothetical protein CYLTODRAFT_372746 [Cylindrobasidium torrendii FP15055 ss-10]|uniref:DUF3533 domain-containing protein n=1 Tax=Cylindrobasidium torrendii FP15055 ss-10 TaxID=1314674 RepID=A0A0D7BH48_9AGAR|nr:hypothetical protein CYLTODRAFT_372746 [Cylindrobasidium torrendii FP15055 ss-10]